VSFEKCCHCNVNRTMGSVVKIESPSTCIVAGPSSYGKTGFVYVLKQANGVFKDPPDAVYYCYNVNQTLFEEMKLTVPNIEFYEGLPNPEILRTWNIQQPGHKILILDDLVQHASKSADIVDVFCQYSHHLNFTCWLLTQNVFNDGKKFRTISLNSHYFVMFNLARDQLQVQTLGRQLFPQNVKFFMDAYRKAIGQKKYSYLFIDISPHSNPLYKLRTNILPNQLMTVFVPLKAS
jgi:hypothetical protein